MVKREMTQEMSVDILGGEQIDPGKLTKAQSDGQVQEDKETDRQTDSRGKGWKTMRVKKWSDGRTPVGWIPFGTNSSTVFAS